MGRGTAEFIKELSSQGYAKTSRSLQVYLRKNPEFNSNVFRFSSGTQSGRGKIIYSENDLFGEKLVYYVLDCEDAKKDFSKFLVEKFLGKNSESKSGLRKSFTQLLHNYGMHWDLCYDRNVIISSR